MKPLQPMVLLSTALLVLASAGAAFPQDFSGADGQAADMMSGLKQQLQQNAQRNQGQLQQAQSSDEDTIRQAGLSDAFLIGAGLKDPRDPQGTFENLHELAASIRVALETAHTLHSSNDNALGSLTCSGTMANMEDSAKALYQIFQKNPEMFKHGCLSNQTAVFNALTGVGLKRLSVRRVMVGAGLEHHAVVVYRGGDWMQGAVFDPWLKQNCVKQSSDMTFPALDWLSKFKTETAISNAHLEP